MASIRQRVCDQNTAANMSEASRTPKVVGYMTDVEGNWECVKNIAPRIIINICVCHYIMPMFLLHFV